MIVVAKLVGGCSIDDLRCALCLGLGFPLAQVWARHGFQDKSLGATQLWELYMTLLKAETGFCQLKGTLGLRPNFHQLEDGLDGHMLMPSPPVYGTLRAA